MAYRRRVCGSCKSRQRECGCFMRSRRYKQQRHQRSFHPARADLRPHTSLRLLSFRLSVLRLPLRHQAELRIRPNHRQPTVRRQTRHCWKTIRRQAIRGRLQRRTIRAQINLAEHSAVQYFGRVCRTVLDEIFNNGMKNANTLIPLLCERGDSNPHGVSH